MFLIVNLFIALSLGVHLEQLEHRMGLTCPLPFLLRPLVPRTHVSQHATLGADLEFVLGCSFFHHDWRSGDIQFLYRWRIHGKCSLHEMGMLLSVDDVGCCMGSFIIFPVVTVGSLRDVSPLT